MMANLFRLQRKSEGADKEMGGIKGGRRTRKMGRGRRVGGCGPECGEVVVVESVGGVR